MSIVNLIGGLGNQMFQYAFGQSLAQECKIKVFFDTTELLNRAPKENFTYRDFELSIFEGEVPLASSDLLRLFTFQPKSLSERIYYRLLRKLKQVRYYPEAQNFVYEPAVWRTSPNTYFEGYWQSELYFQKHEQLIRQCFKFKTPLAGKNLQLAQQMEGENAIAIHVRRGDYANNQHINGVHGTCSPEYYQAAISIIASQVSNPVLYIFSDEPEWVAQNMQFGYPVTYVSHNTGKSSFEDMRLMSLCKHNIIANSSFSWWGAWLNTNKNKIVVAPKQWFATMPEYSINLIPLSWIQI
ncbi:MAG TPA: alpha-1,2-fucosyltransferase [Hymenobacter sp.]|uniref:alpha-1,2-fucosyltransferase n=1 Tax=Hymenobacter sp. TaxID=1898978 RepID=UPI002D7F20EE|nr:alpha-1,2-fucosyltransferase [Hymenobacter sp.]HET9503946.1 alpha-1,2-fucosyltransferase [Hymenobacter sp.]